MGGDWWQDSCRRTMPAGHGGKNAPRICIFRDMSGRSRGTPDWLQIGRRDWNAVSSWRTFWLQAKCVTAAGIAGGNRCWLPVNACAGITEQLAGLLLSSPRNSHDNCGRCKYQPLPLERLFPREAPRAVFIQRRQALASMAF